MRRAWLSLALCAFACGEERLRQAESLTGDPAAGRVIAETTCRECHSASCWPDTPPSLIMNAAVFGWKFGAMPPQDQLSPQDIANVAAWHASCDAGTP
ncbi:MAG: cytochrome c [Archangium sp.]|nr:cytochrome c [Archangium sp.]